MRALFLLLLLCPGVTLGPIGLAFLETSFFVAFFETTCMASQEASLTTSFFFVIIEVEQVAQAPQRIFQCNLLFCDDYRGRTRCTSPQRLFQCNLLIGGFITIATTLMPLEQVLGPYLGIRGTSATNTGFLVIVCACEHTHTHTSLHSTQILKFQVARWSKKHPSSKEYALTQKNGILNQTNAIIAMPLS